MSDYYTPGEGLIKSDRKTTTRTPWDKRHTEEQVRNRLERERHEDLARERDRRKAEEHGHKYHWDEREEVYDKPRWVESEKRRRGRFARMTEFLKKGELPTNRDMTEGLEEAKIALEDTKTIAQTEGLTREGERIIEDAERVMTDAERLILERNRDEKLQRLWRESKLATQELREKDFASRGGAAGLVESEETRKVRERGAQLMKAAQLLGLELATSSSFRRSIGDLIAFFWHVLEGKVESGSQEVRQEVKEGWRAMTTEHDMEKAKDKVSQVTESVSKIALDAKEGKTSMKFTEQEKDELMHRFIRIMRDINSRERTKRAIQELLGLFTVMNEMLTEVRARGQERLKATTMDIKRSEHLDRVSMLSKELFEEFAGHRALDPLIFHVKETSDLMSKSEGMRDYWHDLRHYLLNILREPERLESRDSTEAVIQEGKDLMVRGRELLYRNDTNLLIRDNLRQIVGESRDMVQRVGADPLILKLQKDLRRLAQDLILDERGRIQWKPEALNQLKIIILTSIVEKMRIPLPVMQTENDKMAFRLEGLILRLKDVLPYDIVMENHGRTSFDLYDPKDPLHAGSIQTLVLKLRNINIHTPPADIYFHHKTFPRVEESGKALIDVGGRGMDIDIRLQTSSKTKNIFDVANVACVINKLSLRLEGTQHDMLYNTGIKLFKGRIRRTIEDAIQENIANMLVDLNENLMQLRKMDTVDIKRTAQDLGDKIRERVSG
ncbi:hypothetical protein QOT17_022467 [Balamuthia mandrillaris]